MKAGFPWSEEQFFLKNRQIFLDNDFYFGIIEKLVCP